MEGFTPDDQLLRRAAGGEREAIDAIIRSYANLVHGIAMRQIDDAQTAADISQAVFIIFVQKIRSIRHAGALPGWFLRTTQFAVRDAKRAAIRRRFHEHQAARPEPIMDSPIPEQDSNLKLIDEGIASLNRTDGNLILMRYFQNRQVDAIASSIGISEQTARKRITRAIERLRRFFADRGAAITVAGVTGLLSSAASQSAPAAVVEACVSAAAGAGISTFVASMAKGGLQIMAWSKAKSAAIVAAVVLIGVGTTAVVQQAYRSDAVVQTTTAPAPLEFIEPVPSTFEEADTQMRAHYGLAQGEVIRFIPPPYSPARDVWLSTRPNSRIDPRGISNMSLIWSPQKGFGMGSYGSGGIYLGGIQRLLGFQWYGIEGIEEIAWRNLDGDLIVREEVSRQVKIEAFASFINQHTGKNFRFVPTKRSRVCIVLQGEVKQATTPKKQNGFHAVLVSLAAPDEKTMALASGRSGPPAYVDIVNLDDLGRLLGAPVFLETDRGRGNEYFVGPDARLEEDDPQFESKLRKILDNLKGQVGGEWKIERREIESYVLEPRPGPHPAIHTINNYLLAARAKDTLTAAREFPKGSEKELTRMNELLKINRIVTLEYVSADDSEGLARSGWVHDEFGQSAPIYFYLHKDAGQWRIRLIDFPQGGPIAGIKDEFLRQHPKVAEVHPAWGNRYRIPLSD